MRFLRFVVVGAALLSFCSLQGCAVFMAARQPDRKNVSLFKVGTPRDCLLAEFGKPTMSEERDGKKYEIFTFVQGYGTGTKVGRAFFHGVADVFSLGAWEVIGTPTEAYFDGTKMAFKVSYDDKDCVDCVTDMNKVQPLPEKAAGEKPEGEKVEE